MNGDQRRGWILAASPLAGMAHGLAFGAKHPAVLQWPAFAALGVIVLLLRSRRQWALLLTCCALFWLASYAMGLRWIGSAMIAQDGLGPALGTLVYCLLVCGLACASILSLWLAALLGTSIRSDALYCATLSSAMLCGDLLRELLLPSFPWLAVGYAHVEGPISSLLPVIGVEGAGWFAQCTALLCGASVLSVAHRRVPRQSALIMTAMLAAAVVLPLAIPAATRDQGSLRIAALQTAVPPRDKFRASLFGQHLQEIGDFVRDHPAQLIITPETAVPTTLRALTPVQKAFLEGGVSPTRAVLFGAFAEDSREDVFNSAVMLQRA
ncbi:MAG TPA: hypothetical protein VI653_24285, partial [Steroidobacteraceae bacterium]